MTDGPYRITLIEGDGIGPEVACAARAVIEAAGVTIDWDVQYLGVEAQQRSGSLIPDDTLESIKRNRAALKGPITTPGSEGYPSINVALRQRLDLYACIRPVKSFPGVRSVYRDVDLVVIRENTEDLYGGKEHEVVPGVIESLKVITQVASNRIARYAFDYASREGRKKVTAVHKANIMKLSDGLFLDCCRQVAKSYPAIEYKEMIVDATCMHLVINPSQFDVLLMENLYGDIISDLSAGLVGGLGLVPGINLGHDMAVFEATHGSWPEVAGQNIANPTALILTGALMLRYIGEGEAAERIESAVARVLAEGRVITGDLGGTASTTEYTEEVIKQLSAS